MECHVTHILHLFIHSFITLYFSLTFCQILICYSFFLYLYNILCFWLRNMGFISVKQELLTLPEYLSSPSVFSWFRVTWSLVLCFVDRCLSFCTFYFGHCVVCPSIYEFWLLPWYLQTLFVYVFLYSSIFILSYEFWYGCRSKKKIC
jgi:hypothetical protein